MATFLSHRMSKIHSHYLFFLFMVAFVFPFNFSATKAMRTALPGHFGERWTRFYAFPRRKLFVCRLTVPTLDQTNAYQSSVCTMNDENHQRNHLPRSGWCWRWFVGTVSIHCRTHYPQPHTQINATLANWRDQMRVIKWVNFCCHPPCCVHDGKKVIWLLVECMHFSVE